MNAILYGDAEPLRINVSEFSSTSGASWREGAADYIDSTIDPDSRKGEKCVSSFFRA